MENKKEIIYFALNCHLHKHLHASHLHLHQYENWLHSTDKGKSDPKTPRKIRSGLWNPQNKENHTWPLAWGMHFISHSITWVSVISVGQKKETLSQHLTEWSSPILFDAQKNVFIYWIELGAHRKISKKKNNNLFNQVKPWGKPRLSFYF